LHYNKKKLTEMVVQQLIQLRCIYLIGAVQKFDTLGFFQSFDVLQIFFHEQTIRKCNCEADECAACDGYIEELNKVIQFSTPKQGFAGFFAESIQVRGTAVVCRRIT
jgi:hypothetical protein